MKVERIERKEKDSPALQYVVIFLSLLECAITLYLIYVLLVAPERVKLIGTLFALSLLVLALIFWALEKGYLPEERVYTLE